MDGEISVVRAKPGSREEKKNEIGVEFKVKLSGEELFEAVFMRKVGNGTVVLEVVPPFPPSTTFSPFCREMLKTDQRRNL